MDKSLLFLTLPIVVVAGVALLRGITDLRSAMHTEEVAVLPLAVGGTFDVREVGDLNLSLKGRLGSRDFAHASFFLRDSAGNPVTSTPIIMRSVRTTLAGETTVAVRRFAVRTPGRYLLEVTGVDLSRIAGGSSLVLSRPSGKPVMMRVLWVVGASVMMLGALVFSAVAAFAQPSAVVITTPAVGSPVRTAILNAVRSALALPTSGESRFKVFHLKTANPWAYFEGNEVVHVEGSEWQETDLTVKALLQLDGAAWRVRTLWTLPTNERTPLHEFEARVQEMAKRSAIPEGIFPQTPPRV